ncbi:hypothetical protein [Nostoc commune]|uniref:hypothetical protein n=1 Tax=Nostoc commune TaxID=1178 RepID=UPI0018C79B68|nr:hypothetical protein [Nostoc commune]MBG1263089.1 hypothetical protein [Nostoc commune BAE]
MKTFRKYCDRCKNEIIGGQHDDISDFLESQYPGKDICPDCDLLITLSTSPSASDLIAGLHPGTSLKKCLQIYDL